MKKSRPFQIQISRNLLKYRILSLRYFAPWVENLVLLLFTQLLQ